MNKLIIDNRTAMPMSRAITYAAKVVDYGRMSKVGSRTAYSYFTTFGPEDYIHVSAFLNEKSDRLVITMPRGEIHKPVPGAPPWHSDESVVNHFDEDVWLKEVVLDKPTDLGMQAYVTECCFANDPCEVHAPYGKKPATEPGIHFTEPQPSRPGSPSG